MCINNLTLCGSKYFIMIELWAFLGYCPSRADFSISHYQLFPLKYMSSVDTH